MQSPSTLHDVRHVVAPHTYGLQFACEIDGHEPVPTHTAETVDTWPEQLCARHVVVPLGYAHEARFDPSQLPAHAEPSELHDACPVVGAPLTGLHVPSFPAIAHDSHCPVHVALQQ